MDDLTVTGEIIHQNEIYLMKTEKMFHSSRCEEQFSIATDDDDEPL